MSKHKKHMSPLGIGVLSGVVGFFVGLLILGMVYFAHVKIVNGAPTLLKYALFAPFIFALFNGVLGLVVGGFSALMHRNTPPSDEEQS